MFKTEANPALSNLRRIVQKYSQDKIMILGLGNILKGDDGFGPILMGRLKNRIKAVCLDAATVPENYLGLITKEKPDLILLVDAINTSDNQLGEITLYNSKKISGLNSISTHNANLKLFLDLLSQDCSAKIYLIGINPATLKFEAALSAPAQQAIDELEKLLLEILSQR